MTGALLWLLKHGSVFYTGLIGFLMFVGAAIKLYLDIRKLRAELQAYCTEGHPGG
jgi:hypothetical protein